MVPVRHFQRLSEAVKEAVYIRNLKKKKKKEKG